MLRVDTCIAEEGLLPIIYAVSENAKYCEVFPKEAHQRIMVGRIPETLFAALETAFAAENDRVASMLSIAAASWFVLESRLIDFIGLHLSAYGDNQSMLYKKHANPEYGSLFDVLSRNFRNSKEGAKHESEN